jgi:hypothetical protein
MTTHQREGCERKSFLIMPEHDQKDWSGQPDPTVFLEGHAQIKRKIY